MLFDTLPTFLIESLRPLEVFFRRRVENNFIQCQHSDNY